MPPFPPHLGLLSILPCFPCCNTCYPYCTVCCPLLFLMQLLDVSRREKGKQRGALDDTRGSKGKKRYNAGDWAGYFCSKCDFDPLEFEFWKDFWTHDSPLQALTFAQIKIFKSQFSSQPHPFLLGRRCAGERPNF